MIQKTGIQTITSSLLAAAAGAAMLVTAVLVTAGAGHAAEAETNTYRYLRLFGSIFERVRADYVEEKTDKQLIEAAIQGRWQSVGIHQCRTRDSLGMAIEREINAIQHMPEHQRGLCIELLHVRFNQPLAPF